MKGHGKAEGVEDEVKFDQLILALKVVQDKSHFLVLVLVGVPVMRNRERGEERRGEKKG